MKYIQSEVPFLSAQAHGTGSYFEKESFEAAVNVDRYNHFVRDKR